MQNPVTATELTTLYDLILQHFPDNTAGRILPADARLVLASLADGVNGAKVRLDGLTTNQVKGSVFRVPYVELAAGQPTVPTALVPVAFRILGMEVLATNGTDAASAAAGVRAAPMTFQLLADSAGAVDALVDEKPTTTAMVKAHWVRTSGTALERINSFDPLELEDVEYKAGDVRRWTFPDGHTELVQWIDDSIGFSHPAPTGLDTDPIYRRFAPPASTLHEQNTDAGTRLGEFRLRLDTNLMDQGEQRTVLAFEGMRGSAVAAISFRAQDADNVERPALEQCLAYTGTAADVWTPLGSQPPAPVSYKITLPFSGGNNTTGPDYHEVAATITRVALSATATGLSISTNGGTTYTALAFVNAVFTGQFAIPAGAAVMYQVTFLGANDAAGAVVTLTE